MALTFHQRRRLREGRKCLTVPARRRLSDEAKCDLAAIAGILVVLVLAAIHSPIPLLQHWLIPVLLGVAAVSGGWALVVAAMMVARAWRARP